jgi:hypothetical protein
MIIYQVTATVDPILRERFENYMQERHIPEVFGTGFFQTASFERVDDGRYRMRYGLESREKLDEYVRQAAPRLRADVAEHFPDGIELSREVSDVVATFA